MAGIEPALREELDFKSSVSAYFHHTGIDEASLFLGIHLATRLFPSYCSLYAQRGFIKVAGTEIESVSFTL